VRIGARALLLWVFAGVALALTIAGAGASPLTITIGSVTGTPTQNICGTNCTYVPFTDATTPTLEVPFDGTITSFSVNSGSAGNIVELRVLQPAAGGQFTGVSSSPAETLSGGVSTFTGLSIPVTAGEVIGLDNGSSAIIFDTTDPTQHTAYYSPALASGATAAPTTTQPGSRLLMSATMQEAATTSTSTPATVTTTTTVTTTVTETTTSAPGEPPAISSVGESSAAWRESGRPAKNKLPTGTTFSFKLNEPARVLLSFFEQLSGRGVKGSCAAPTRHNSRDPGCTRAVATGSLSLAERAGTDKVSFRGRTSNGHVLKPGNYVVLISAANNDGEHSNAGLLGFTASAK
jgi:hypothetical protein